MKIFCVILFILCVFINLFLCFKQIPSKPLPHHSEGYDNYKSIADLITDIVLAEVKEYLQVNNETAILLPPIELEFSQPFMGLDLTGEFKADGGIFRNPATISREGPSKITRSTNLFVLTFEVGFKDMNINFARYSASLLGFLKESGKIYVGVGGNSVFIEVTVRFLPRCVVSLTNVTMTTFNDLDVHVTGLGVLNCLQNQIVEWVLASYKSSFTPIIEQVLQEKLQEELAKTSLCKYKKE